jgi:Outer membrane protein beta-barrel domain
MSAQEFSYGPVLGLSFYGSNNNSAVERFGLDKSSFLSFGAYGEYNFNKNIGVKTEVLLNKRKLYYKATNAFGLFSIEYDFSIVEVNPSFKYDFGQEYRKGFYMLLGPKFSFATKITSDGEDVKDDFETFLYGIQLGFGTRVYKFIDVQTKLDYDATAFAEYGNDRSSKFFGATLSLNLDVERLINSK